MDLPPSQFRESRWRWPTRCPRWVRRSWVATLGVAGLVVLCPAPLHAAYIDPGTGSLVWQLVVAGMLGATFHFRRAISALVRLVRRGLGPKTPPSPPT